MKCGHRYIYIFLTYCLSTICLVNLYYDTEETFRLVCCFPYLLKMAKICGLNMDPHHFPRLTFCITPSGSLDWIVPKELLRNNEDSACLPVGNLSGGYLVLFGTFQTSTTHLKSPPKLLWSSVIYGKGENTSSGELDSTFFKSCRSFEKGYLDSFTVQYKNKAAPRLKDTNSPFTGYTTNK